MMPGNAPSGPRETYVRRPRRGGEYPLEECSFGHERGEMKFFHTPDIAALRVELKCEYVIPAGESEPHIRKIFWQCADNGFWEEIPANGWVYFAAIDLIEQDAEWAKFVAYANENATEIDEPVFSVFEREIRRARMAA